MKQTFKNIEEQENFEYHSQIVISSQLTIFDEVEKAISNEDHKYLKMNEYFFILNNVEIEVL